MKILNFSIRFLNACSYMFGSKPMSKITKINKFQFTSRPSRRRVITRRRVVCIPAECEDGPPSSRVCLACFVSFVYFFCRDPSDEFLRGGTLRPPAPPLRRHSGDFLRGGTLRPPAPPFGMVDSLCAYSGGGGGPFNCSIFHIFRERCRKS